MIGELILTSFTYDQGRTALNTAFSGGANFSTVSGTTFISGSTNLYNIFQTTADGNDITRVQPGSNISTGGTGNFPIVNIVASPSFNNATFSGTVLATQLYTQIASATTGTITYSPNFNNGSFQKITISGNTNFGIPLNIKAGARYTIVVCQDATGGHTITWNSPWYLFSFGTDPVPNIYSGASSINMFNFVSDGAVLLHESLQIALTAIP